jgi:hypothetical protein
VVHAAPLSSAGRRLPPSTAFQLVAPIAGATLPALGLTVTEGRRGSFEPPARHCMSHEARDTGSRGIQRLDERFGV